MQEIKNKGRRFLLLVLTVFFSAGIYAQTGNWREMYKVKKKDTQYSISKQYGITVEELKAANPEMAAEDYKLKKGDFIFIPFPSNEANGKENASEAWKVDANDVRNRAVRVGVMLPLHNVDGDGRRMTEYYRGILMACDSLKRKGISTEVYAWNVNVDADIRTTLIEENAAKCDIIFGPLYTKQVAALGDFCRKNDIKMVIPFSISGNDVARNTSIFQVYQPQDSLYAATVDALVERFPDGHLVIVDCNDSTSKKGVFTSMLRKKIEAEGKSYNLTSLATPDDAFAKAFQKGKTNVVVLNTGRSPELNATFAKLDRLTSANPDLKIAMMGYTEWLMYQKVYMKYYHKYNAYIPSTFYYNAQSADTQRMEQNYKLWFKEDMQAALPRFAITGYDQARFFIEGLCTKGKAFDGTAGSSTYRPLQTALKFKRIENGGLQNKTFMLVHYAGGDLLEAISY